MFVDASLALIDLKQRNMGYATAGVDFGASDFSAVARAFNIQGVWADNREVLANELSEAQERDNATLIACRIGARPYDGRF